MHFRQAIVTKYIDPTTMKGSRVKAKCQAGSLTLNWDSSVDVCENHFRAAVTLASRYDWLDRNKIYGGALPSSTGYAFVLIPKGEELK